MAVVTVHHRLTMDPALGRWFFVVTGDPSDLGLEAAVGSLAIQIDGALPVFWSKTDDEDTDWTAVNFTVGGTALLTNAGAPDATVGVGVAGTGSLCTDTTNANLYINTGDATTPDWVAVLRAES